MTALTDPEELRKRIALAKAAIRDTAEDTHTEWMYCTCVDDGKCVKAHIAANSPDAVIALCEELLAARSEIAGLRSLTHEDVCCTCIKGDHD